MGKRLMDECSTEDAAQFVLPSESSSGGVRLLVGAGNVFLADA